MRLNMMKSKKEKEKKDEDRKSTVRIGYWSVDVLGMLAGLGSRLSRDVQCR